MDTRLTMSYQRALVAKAANSVVHCIRKSAACRLKEVILVRYSATATLIPATSTAATQTTMTGTAATLIPATSTAATQTTTTGAAATPVPTTVATQTPATGTVVLKPWRWMMQLN